MSVGLGGRQHQKEASLNLSCASMSRDWQQHKQGGIGMGTGGQRQWEGQQEGTGMGTGQRENMGPHLSCASTGGD